MPELPEVETIRQDLRKKIIGKKLAGIEIVQKSSVKAGIGEIQDAVKGNFVQDIERRGKLLMFKIQGDKYLLIHLKMTGQLIYEYDHHLLAGGHNLPRDFESLPGKHTRVIFHFSDQSKLFFNDMRKFGYVKLVGPKEKEKIVSAYGPEPLESGFTLAIFRNILSKKTGNIKAVLMDQKAIAGIGNIYSDEICFCARVLPTRKANKLKPEEIRRIFTCIKKILTLAIKHRGTTFRDFLDSEGKKGRFVDFLKVYDHDGELCLRCKKAKITKARVAGRGCCFCKNCQE